VPANLASGQRAIVRSIHLVTSAAHADLWICGQRKRVAHRPTGSKNKSKRQFDCFGSTALKPGPSQPRPSARAAATPVAAFGTYPGRHSQKRQCNRIAASHPLAVLREHPLERRVVQQPVVLRLDRPVSLAGCVLNPFQIQNLNVSTLVANKTGLLKRMGGGGNTASLRAQHLGEELLRQ
jgi:hypothetical protein